MVRMDLDTADILLNEEETLLNTSATEACYVSLYGKHDNLSDTAFCTDYMAYESHRTADSQSGNDLYSHDDGHKLVLGLGPNPTSYSGDYSSRGNKAKESMNLFNQSFVSGSDSRMLELKLSWEYGEPVQALAHSDQHQLLSLSETSSIMPSTDGSSSSAKESGGYMPSLLFAPRPEIIGPTGNQLDLGSEPSTFLRRRLTPCLHLSPEPSGSNGNSLDAIADRTIPGTPSDQRGLHNHMKKCRFKGCSKGARGASGLCIGHGGGQRCQKPGCNKGAESRTAYCKAHGGGRRCQQLGCTKSAEGKTDFCIAHGGGRRCGHPGCDKAARGKSGLCIKHGGGKRCTIEGCARSAEGQAGLCISHGGGRRCQHPGCNKGAQGSTMHCKAHGGGKRCVFSGCTKGAEGSTPLCKGHGGGKRCLFDGGGACPKSVHGGTDYCVAHGGGKRCTVPGCTKSARGRTDCCVRHGGGKRCQSEGCGKSAQGSTDFCKAHGGGKRCSWGPHCEKFARGKSGLCAAHGSMMLSRKAGSVIGPGLFQGLVSASTTAGSSMGNDGSSSELSAVSDCAKSCGDAERHELLIPPQLLVPLSMKSQSASSGLIEGNRDGGRLVRRYGSVVPEGRVHGGGLLSLFGGDLKNAVDTGII